MNNMIDPETLTIIKELQTLCISSIRSIRRHDSYRWKILFPSTIKDTSYINIGLVNEYRYYVRKINSLLTTKERKINIDNLGKKNNFFTAISKEKWKIIKNNTNKKMPEFVQSINTEMSILKTLIIQLKRAIHDKNESIKKWPLFYADHQDLKNCSKIYNEFLKKITEHERLLSFIVSIKKQNRELSKKYKRLNNSIR